MADVDRQEAMRSVFEGSLPKAMRQAQNHASSGDENNSVLVAASILALAVEVNILHQNIEIWGRRIKNSIEKN